MKLKELKSGQGKVDIEAVVKTKGEVKVMNKFGNELKLSNAIISDDSGDIALTLWNADAEKVKVGDKIKITNGYVSEFNGKLQLTSGKFGKLEVINGDSKSKKEESDEDIPDGAM
jgi:ssDNA-binding replication factor A large subunit